jgi:hypothetical protein
LRPNQASDSAIDHPGMSTPPRDTASLWWVTSPGRPILAVGGAVSIRTSAPGDLDQRPDQRLDIRDTLGTVWNGTAFVQTA